MKKLNIFKTSLFVIIFMFGSCFEKSGEMQTANADNKKIIINNVDEALQYYQKKFPPAFKYGSPNSKETIIMKKHVIDDDLQYLHFFTELKKLYVIGSKKVTDKGLEYIKDLTTIEFLVLWGTNISIKGLQKLSKLKNVKYLSIANTNITDDDLQILAELFPQLDTLSLSANRIKGPGIQYLKKLPLAELYLDKTLISDETVKYFAGFKRCEISLHNTKVTEKGKEEILRITENCSVSIKSGDMAPLRE